jgi:integrase
MLILCGQRRHEVAGLTWGELSADLTTWAIPPERPKNHVKHIVPISEPVRTVIRATLPKDEKEALRIVMQTARYPCARVFPGTAGMIFSEWSKSKTALDKAITGAQTEAAAKIGVTAAPLVPLAVHDLRRSAASGPQRLGTRLEVTEAISESRFRQPRRHCWHL